MSKIVQHYLRQEKLLPSRATSAAEENWRVKERVIVTLSLTDSARDLARPWLREAGRSAGWRGWTMAHDEGRLWCWEFGVSDTIPIC